MRLIFTESNERELFKKSHSIARTYYKTTRDDVLKSLTEKSIAKILREANEKDYDVKPKFDLEKDVYVKIVVDDKLVRAKIFQSDADTEKVRVKK